MQPHQPEPQQPNQQQQSLYDQTALQTLKQQVTLSNHQLLQLTYNDQKFYQKLKQLNHFGCLHIKKTQFPEALVYLSEAEKVLEYAASCGKTIERKLIIATLNNEAALYQKAWQLQKAQSYLQAIIYNISSFFENNSQSLNTQLNKPLQFTNEILNENSTQYQDFSISLWRKKSLVIFYLQYCAINSQNKNNQRAFESAQKALTLIKEVSMDLYVYEKYLLEHEHAQRVESSQDEHQDVSQQDQHLLYQIGTFRQINTQQAQFPKFYNSTVKHIALYMKRLQSPPKLSQQIMQIYRQCFENYSIGTIMQINASQLDEQTDRVDLRNQLYLVQKHFKAIYLSVGHFILGTESRFIASEKYTLDENERRQSPEFQQSQIYHLCSIIILTKFLLCESGYFDHIVNSFRNHYKVDIMEDARLYLQNNPHLNQADDFDDEEGYLFQKPKIQKSPCLEVEEIEHLQSQIRTVQEIPGEVNSNPPGFDLNTEESQELGDDAPRELKEKGSRNTKSTKLSKNTVCSQTAAKEHHHVKQQHTGTKKLTHKKSTTNLGTKNTQRIQTLQTHKAVLTSSHHEHKATLKPMNIITSRQKQYRQKLTQLNSNSKATSRSKRKSDYQFLSNHKKINSSHDKIVTQKGIQRTQSKRQTVYIKRQSDYMVDKVSRSKSKNKRIPTLNDGERRATLRRKESYGDLRKAKKVEEEYGFGSNHKYTDAVKNQVKTSRNNINVNLKNEMKKSKQRKQSQDNKMKLTSPDIKMKKLKSPARNIKK